MSMSTSMYSTFISIASFPPLFLAWNINHDFDLGHKHEIGSDFKLLSLSSLLSSKWGPTPASFHLFLSFQTQITIFTANNYVKKCPSSMRCWDSNSQHFVHESPLIITRPGLLQEKISKHFFHNTRLIQ